LLASAATGLLLVLGAASLAGAVDYSGTVQFQGQTQIPVAIPGIDYPDLLISIGSETESTGNGEKCSILGTSADNADALGAYPDAGQVSADMLLERGGPQIPDGTCVVTVRARATDGVSVSARGSQTVFVPAADIDASGTVVVSDIVVRQSKASAEVGKECAKWLKKQLKLRAKCNYLLLKKGPDAGLKCRDAGPEPANCDPGDFADAILALAHGGNDQQTDPPSADLIDAIALKDQITCQKRLGKAAAIFAAKRVQLIDKKCLATGLDSESCRNTQTNDTKKKLDQIAKCVGDQVLDGMTGRAVPQAGEPCDVCIDGGGAFDQKCMRACFQTTIAELSDGIVGDIAECGNGIVQTGEFCDDGNLLDGDCCSSSCGVTMPGVEGPNGDASCADGIDNDCDGLTDGADPDCL